MTEPVRSSWKMLGCEILVYIKFSCPICIETFLVLILVVKQNHEMVGLCCYVCNSDAWKSHTNFPYS